VETPTGCFQIQLCFLSERVRWAVPRGISVSLSAISGLTKRFSVSWLGDFIWNRPHSVALIGRNSSTFPRCLSNPWHTLRSLAFFGAQLREL